MDNITWSLIKELLKHLDIPDGKGHYEEEFHQVIKKNGLNLNSPRITKTAIDFLLKKEFEFAYIQVIFNSVIPEGTAEEFMRDSVKFQVNENHYGDLNYNLWLLDKPTLLKKKDPVWVYQNYEDIKKFMSESWEPYLKIKQIINDINSF
jgi:hypothetical protein